MLAHRKRKYRMRRSRRRRGGRVFPDPSRQGLDQRGPRRSERYLPDLKNLRPAGRLGPGHAERAPHLEARRQCRGQLD